MINRRHFLGLTATAGAALTLPPHLLRALQKTSANVIQRAIPSTGEKLPVVGLTLANHASCADVAALREVVKAYIENGGRLLDTYHGNEKSELITADLVTGLGVENRIFLSGRIPPSGLPEPSTESAKAHVASAIAAFKVPRMDLAMVGINADPAYFAYMKQAKKEGLVRYIGVSSIADPQIEAFASVMRNEPIDFIGVRYGIDYRIMEDTLLPLAQERKIGVLAYFPFGGNSGASCTNSPYSLFTRVQNTPLPAWAAEFGAKTWAQFCLKYVISNPAVTVVRAGTSKAAHIIDNLEAGSGPLPDAATRKRMTELFDSIPAPVMPPPDPARLPGISLPAAVLDRYVGEYRAESGFTVTFRRAGTVLVVKPGPNPEVPLNARTETRLQDPRGPFFDFQLDAQGKVTGVILEQEGPQGTQRIPLQRQ
jgi:diketogulonate reductase-like aldo/keto reductase